MNDYRLSPPGFDAQALAHSRPLPQARPADIGQGGGRQAQVETAARDFEAVFISQMLSHMWAGIEVDETFGGGHGEEMFRSLMIEEQGKMMARAGGLGLADDVKRTMLQIQEARTGENLP